MNQAHRVSILKILLPIALLPLIGCAEGEGVNPRTIARALRLWNQAKLSRYDLEWTVSGARQGHYLVRVRNGSVQSVASIGPDGQKTPLHPRDLSYYSVEGLLHALEEESDQELQSQPFGLPAGTVASLRVEIDPSLGYPIRYRRLVNGPRGSLALDVLTLNTDVDVSRKERP